MFLIYTFLLLAFREKRFLHWQCDRIRSSCPHFALHLYPCIVVYVIVVDVFEEQSIIPVTSPNEEEAVFVGDNSRLADWPWQTICCEMQMANSFVDLNY